MHVNVKNNCVREYFKVNCVLKSLNIPPLGFIPDLG